MLVAVIGVSSKNLVVEDVTLKKPTKGAPQVHFQFNDARRHLFQSP